jgi:hypothetical protein
VLLQPASESHVPRFRAGVGTWRPGYMIPIRLPWRHRARPSATLHEIQVCPEGQTCHKHLITAFCVRQRPLARVARVCSSACSSFWRRTPFPFFRPAVRLLAGNLGGHPSLAGGESVAGRHDFHSDFSKAAVAGFTRLRPSLADACVDRRFPCCSNPAPADRGRADPAVSRFLLFRNRSCRFFYPPASLRRCPNQGIGGQQPKLRKNFRKFVLG